LSHLANARRVRPAYKLGRSLPFRNYDTCTFKPLFPLFAHAGGVGLGPEGSLRVEPVQSVRGTLRVEPGGPGPQPGVTFFCFLSLGTSVPIIMCNFHQNQSLKVCMLLKKKLYKILIQIKRLSQIKKSHRVYVGYQLCDFIFETHILKGHRFLSWMNQRMHPQNHSSPCATRISYGASRISQCATRRR
jgi:hypothetical protein